MIHPTFSHSSNGLVGWAIRAAGSLFSLRSTYTYTVLCGHMAQLIKKRMKVMAQGGDRVVLDLGLPV